MTAPENRFTGLNPENTPTPPVLPTQPADSTDAAKRQTNTSPGLCSDPTSHFNELTPAEAERLAIHAEELLAKTEYYCAEEWSFISEIESIPDQQQIVAMEWGSE